MQESGIIKSKAKKKRPQKPKVVLEYNRLLKKLKESNKELEELKEHLEAGLVWVNTHVQPRMAEWNTIKVEIMERLLPVLEDESIDLQVRDFVLAYVQQTAEEIMNAPVLDKSGYSDRLEAVVKRLQEVGDHYMKLLPKNERKKLDKELKKEFDARIEEIVEAMKMQGLDIKLDDLQYDMDTNQLMETIEERIHEAHEKMNNPTSENEGQHDNQADRKAKQGSNHVTEIYRRLARWVHPDLEQDDKLKLEKSEWMKQITVAYEKGDLATLIQLECAIAREFKITLEVPGEKQLKDYNRTLKEQIEDRDEEYFLLSHHPRFAALHYYFEPFGGAIEMNYSKQYLLSQMKDEMKTDKRRLNGLKKGEVSRFEIIGEIVDEMSFDNLFPFGDIDLNRLPF